MSDIDKKVVEVHGRLRVLPVLIAIAILKGVKFFFSQLYYLITAVFIVITVLGTVSLSLMIIDIGPELVWYRLIDWLQAQGIM